VQKLKQQAADDVAVAENLYIEKKNLKKALTASMTQAEHLQQHLAKVYWALH
jgi:hypothetical protein